MMPSTNCCMPNSAPGFGAAPMLGPRRMKSFWAFMLCFCSERAMAGIQNLRSEQGHDPRIILVLAEPSKADFTPLEGVMSVVAMHSRCSEGVLLCIKPPPDNVLS